MLLFSLMSILVVYSAVLNLVHYNGTIKSSPVSYLLKHAAILMAGMGLTFMAHRIKYLEQLYDYILGHDGVVMWTGAEILDWYRTQVR